MGSNRPAIVQRGHRFGNVAEKQVKGPIQGGVAGNNDIVAGPEFPLLKIGRKSRLQPAANAVTRNGVTDFLSNREPETGARAGTFRRARSFAHFNQKCRRG